MAMKHAQFHKTLAEHPFNISELHGGGSTRIRILGKASMTGKAEYPIRSTLPVELTSEEGKKAQIMQSDAIHEGEIVGLNKARDAFVIKVGKQDFHFKPTKLMSMRTF